MTIDPRSCIYRCCASTAPTSGSGQLVLAARDKGRFLLRGRRLPEDRLTETSLADAPPVPRRLGILCLARWNVAPTLRPPPSALSTAAARLASWCSAAPTPPTSPLTSARLAKGVIGYPTSKSIAQLGDGLPAEVSDRPRHHRRRLRLAALCSTWDPGS